MYILSDIWAVGNGPDLAGSLLIRWRNPAGGRIYLGAGNSPAADFLLRDLGFRTLIPFEIL